MDAGSFTVAICLLSVPVAVVPAAEQTSRPTVPATGEFLTRAGEQLLLGGKPFRAIGVNKRELLDQYLADLLGQDPRTSRNLAIKTLDGLADRGIDVIRICATQYWPGEMLCTFQGDDQARRIAWQRFDEMLADCAQRRIRLVVSIGFYPGLWSDLAHESLQELFTNPHSASRRLHDTWLRELVTRYKDTATVLFWELPNESNLYADLQPQHPQGFLTTTPSALTPGLVIRDVRNHVTSDELAAWCRETARLIESLDPNHLVGSGMSIPRPFAWHLWMGSIRRASNMDWTRDTPEQQADYLRLITPEPIDLISIHWYMRPDFRSELDQIATAVKVANELHKPLYLGEMGPDPNVFPGEVYGHDEARVLLQRQLELCRNLDIPLAMVWGYDEYCEVVHEPVIRPDRHPEVVKLLQGAQAEARQVTDSHPVLPKKR